MIRFLAPLLVAAWLGAACPAQAAAPTPVDVNKASQAELETVKGIGPAMSSKILAARRSGDFRNWDDFVERVSGVGPGNARRMSEAGLRIAGSGFQGSGAAAGKPVRYVAPDRGAQGERKPGARASGEKNEVGSSRSTSGG